MGTPINEVGEEREVSTATTKKTRKDESKTQHLIIDFCGNEPRLDICDDVDWHNKTLSFVKRDAHGNKRIIAMGGGCISTELFTSEYNFEERSAEIKYLSALLFSEHNKLF